LAGDWELGCLGALEDRSAQYRRSVGWALRNNPPPDPLSASPASQTEPASPALPRASWDPSFVTGAVMCPEDRSQERAKR